MWWLVVKKKIEYYCDFDFIETKFKNKQHFTERAFGMKVIKRVFEKKIAKWLEKSLKMYQVSCVEEDCYKS